MARAAIFVEGQTELAFVKLLLTEMIGKDHVEIKSERRKSGGYVSLSVDRPNAIRHEILLVDCCGDGAVLSAIKERHHGLTAAGYRLIIGLRDLYPLPIADYQRTLNAVRGRLPLGGCPVHMTIALTEIEAWFIQEDSHFLKIDPFLTPAAIKAATNFDVTTDSAETLPHAAGALRSMYRIARKGYGKSAGQVARTVNALDMVALYVDKRAMLGSFDDFAKQIESFL